MAKQKNEKRLRDLEDHLRPDEPELLLRYTDEPEIEPEENQIVITYDADFRGL